MRIRKIQLSWFRGAGAHVELATGDKSVVVYGANGAGKSTFPDAFEYLAGNGKIRHLAHEYSRVQNSVPNTHTPTGDESYVRFETEAAIIRAGIAPNGALSIETSNNDLLTRLQSCGVERLILRQDEVASFIHSTKGEKYSALLPLLGLTELEEAAVKLRKLSQRVASRAKLQEKQGAVEQVKASLSLYWSTPSEESILASLQTVASRYLETAPNDLETLASKLSAEIEKRIGAVDPEHRRFLLLQQVSELEVAAKLTALAEARVALEGRIESFVEERIAVLEPTLRYAETVRDEGEDAICPACGQSVKLEDLLNHVRAELDALEDVRSLRIRAISAQTELALAIRQACNTFRHPELAAWLEQEIQGEIRQAAAAFCLFDSASPDELLPKEQLQALADVVCKLDDCLRRALKKMPPTSQELSEHHAMVEAAVRFKTIESLEREIDAVQQLTQVLDECHEVVRAQIKATTRETVDQISTEIQRLWAKLHPGEKIEDIHLEIPGDADKAIDIALKFYGVEQPSPRLTLSEGHRNSLGLCIFFALVLLDKDADHPVILDDIVSSLDREHRGMLVDILREDFADRQVFLFTHDREWYTELRFRLSAKDWTFSTLSPWDGPSVGLRWAMTAGTFDDARAFLPSKPETAGNEVRKIMDVKLAIAAEKLRISMPYLRGDKNDHRTSPDFLRHIISVARTRFRKKNGSSFIANTEAIPIWEEALGLLLSWANRASHGGSLTLGEAERLIEVCERAIQEFQCGSCGEWVWIADQAGRERLQCGCGDLLWKYD